MPVKENREYRNLVLETRKADEGDTDDKKIVKGYASTFNQPYVLYSTQNYVVSEIVDRHAFDECEMDDVIFQYDHAGRVFARKSNGTLKVEPDDNGLYIEADLGGTEIGRNLYEEIDGGYTTKMSFGFTVTEDKWEDLNREDGTVESVRTILKVGRLYDVSAVSLPANDATSISVRSLSDGVITRLEAERLHAEEIRKAKLALKIQILREEF